MHVRHQVVALRRGRAVRRSPGCGVPSKSRCRSVTRLWRFVAVALHVGHQVVAFRRSRAASPSPGCGVSSSRDPSASPARRVASRSRTTCLGSAPRCIEAANDLPRQRAGLQRGHERFASPARRVATRPRPMCLTSGQGCVEVVTMCFTSGQRCDTTPWSAGETPALSPHFVRIRRPSRRGHPNGVREGSRWPRRRRCHRFRMQKKGTPAGVREVGQARSYGTTSSSTFHAPLPGPLPGCLFMPLQTGGNASGVATGYLHARLRRAFVTPRNVQTPVPHRVGRFADEGGVRSVAPVQLRRADGGVILPGATLEHVDVMTRKPHPQLRCRDGLRRTPSASAPSDSSMTSSGHVSSAFDISS